MALQIEKGKFYRARNGRKVGPMTRVADSATYSPPWRWTNAPDGHLGSYEHYLWRDDGTEALLLHTESPLDLIAEWVDEYPVWRDMTPEQKGGDPARPSRRQNLGGPGFTPGKWIRIVAPAWYPDRAYRIKPHEPKREKQMAYWTGRNPTKTYVITFETVDGTPDPTTLKMHTPN